MSTVLPHATSASSVVEVLSGLIVLFAGLSVSPMGEVVVPFPGEAVDVRRLLKLGCLVVVIKRDHTERC